MNQKIYSVSDINARVKRMFEDHLRPMWIEGEISNYKKHTSGHIYLTLKDDRAQLRCVMFRSSAARLTFTPDHGMMVRAYGRLGVFEAQGSYQLYIERMEPAGQGALHMAFETLKAQLQKEGLFEPEHKQGIPEFPKRIGIVTSETGAAIRDIVNVISRRFPLVKLVLCPAKVQGDGAAAEIVKGIEAFNALPDPEKPDLLIVGRGGGSLEDLWAFNEEIVARTVFASRIPIISAVGHEVDYTISDFVADRRAPTPSAAAEMAVPDSQRLLNRLVTNGGRMSAAVTRKIETCSLKLKHKAACDLFRPMRHIRDLQLKLDTHETRMVDLLKQGITVSRNELNIHRSRLVMTGPRMRLAETRSQMRQMTMILSQWMRSSLDHHGHRMREAAGWSAQFNLDAYRAEFDIISARLQGFDPRAILARGYAICVKRDGSIIKSYRDVRKNEKIDVELGEGKLDCKVENRRFL